MKGSTIVKVKRYINRIRNEKKQGYANCYFAWLLDKKVKAPNSENFGIKIMTAQAVELNISEIVYNSF